MYVILVATWICKNGDYEPYCLLYGAQCLPDLLHRCCRLPLEFIAKKNFDLELQLINASLIYTMIA